MTKLFDDVMAKAYAICQHTLQTNEMTWYEQLYLDTLQKELVAHGIIDPLLRDSMAVIGKLGVQGKIKVSH